MAAHVPLHNRASSLASVQPDTQDLSARQVHLQGMFVLVACRECLQSELSCVTIHGYTAFILLHTISHAIIISSNFMLIHVPFLFIYFSSNRPEDIVTRFMLYFRVYDIFVSISVHGIFYLNIR